MYLFCCNPIIFIFIVSMWRSPRVYGDVMCVCLYVFVFRVWLIRCIKIRSLYISSGWKQMNSIELCMISVTNIAIYIYVCVCVCVYVCIYHPCMSCNSLPFDPYSHQSFLIQPPFPLLNPPLHLPTTTSQHCSLRFGIK